LQILRETTPKYLRSNFKNLNKITIMGFSQNIQETLKRLNALQEEFEIHVSHFFEPIIKSTGQGLIKIIGWHHDINNILEKSGLFKFINKVMFTNGYYKTNIEMIGTYTNTLIQKSFFPTHWSREYVLQTIHYVLKNAQVVQEITNHKTQMVESLILQGFTQDNISVKVIFNIALKSIVSAYPEL